MNTVCKLRVFAFLMVVLTASRGFAQSPIVTTIAGNGTTGYTGDGGPGTAASLSTPQAVAADSAGNVYVADFGNNRIRQVTPSGLITSLPPELGGTSYGMTVDSRGNLYVAISHRILRRSPDGTITAVAGSGAAGFSGDGGPATSAQLFLPYDIAVDRVGNLYIADFNNRRVRKVSIDGFITTVAGDGNCCSSGDGGLATAASLDPPQAVAVDTAGNLYIVELGFRIRKVSVDGLISTVAGNGSCCTEGDGGPATAAQLFNPRGIVVDAAGNIYFGDGSRVRKVTPGGVISTIAGTTTGGYGGDGGPASAALFGDIRDIAVDGSGNIFVAELQNNRVRKISGAGAFSQVGAFAHFASGGGWKTTLALINPSNIAIAGRINFRADDGTPIALPLSFTQTGAVANTSSTPFTVAPKATLFIETEAPVLLSGWAEVQSAGPLRGYAALRFRSPGLPDSEGVVALDYQSASSIVLSYDNTAGFQTGIAIANESESLAVATVTVRDDAGALLGISQLPLQSLGHTAVYVSSRFPQAAGRRGTIEVESTATIRLGGISIRFNPSGTFIFLPQ